MVPNALALQMQRKPASKPMHSQEEVTMAEDYFWDDGKYGGVLEQAAWGSVRASGSYHSGATNARVGGVIRRSWQLDYPTKVDAYAAHDASLG